VKWVGYPESESTWEKKEDISSKPIMAYDAKHPLDWGYEWRQDEDGNLDWHRRHNGDWSESESDTG
jgi:hypothetical protein